MEKLDCLFVGSSPKDNVMLVESPPVSDQRIAGSRLFTTCGGCAARAALAHQHLGAKTGVVTAVGDDETGDYVRRDTMSHRYAYANVIDLPGCDTTTAFILLERNGKRLISVYGGCIDKLEFEMIDKTAFHSTAAVHLGVLRPDVLLALARYVKEHTAALLSIDGGNFSRELTDSLLPYCDIFIPDNKTAMNTHGLVPREACRYYVEHGAKFAAVTFADQGVFAFDGKKEYHAPAPVVNVIDTTGAGDNFHGAFLFARGQEYGIDAALRFANTYASLACEGLGGRERMPSREEVDRVMKTLP